MRRFLRLTLLIGVLAVASAGVAAGDLGVSVAEEGDDIVVEVSSNGVGVEGANVSVSGVDEPTDIDGDYVTGEDGRILFAAEETANMTGVIYLRLTVDYQGTSRSLLTSIMREPDFGDAGLGQRLSMAMSVSAAETQGEVESRLKVAEAHRPIGATYRAELLSNHVNDRLMALSEARFELQVVGSKYATGDISDRDYYVDSIYRTSEIAYLERDIPYTARALSQVDPEALEREDVDVDALQEVLNQTESGEEIDGDRRIR